MEVAMIDSGQQGAYLSIPKAAAILKVTDKTIRNYIDRGLLAAEKWNGSWRIEFRNLSEIFYKKYGKKLEQTRVESISSESNVQISREEYDALQQRSGRLEAAEARVEENRAENRILNDRVVQLEASSASGWTEARQYKDAFQKMEKELKSAQVKVSEAQLEVDWLRRELDGYRKSEEEHAERVRNLEEKTRDLLQVVEDRENDLERCEKGMEELRRKYRRDCFLG